MTQITLGIVSLSLKTRVIEKLNQKRRQLKIVYEKQFQLTREHAVQILKREIKQQRILVYGIILEGSNAIQDWLNITHTLTASLFIFGSSNLENANHETLWLKNLNFPSSSSFSFSNNMSTTQKKTRPLTQRTTADKKLTEQSKEATRNKLTTTTRGGVSKPPVSLITGRTRKTSRLTTEKPQKKTTTTASKPPIDPKQKKSVALKKTTKPASTKQSKPVSKNTPAAKETSVAKDAPVLKETSAVKDVPVEKDTSGTEDTPFEKEKDDTPIENEEKENKLNISETPDNPAPENVTASVSTTSELEKLTIAEPISHLSTCSTDEHDAEVAATTSKKPTFEQVPVLTQSGRSSFSPTASLPRPETPEVDQLRLKFETLSTTTQPPQVAKKSSMSPEFVARIKDMKPRGPVGARVKSMVELFMDENLNKWEF